ncbi:hypothetical protein QBC39DRAFT_10187 [Podospora conica]|nr:hypothetical protein QBC39DRAFT_10187 [Schizothecium conicum]
MPDGQAKTQNTRSSPPVYPHPLLSLFPIAVAAAYPSWGRLGPTQSLMQKESKRQTTDVILTTATVHEGRRLLINPDDEAEASRPFYRARLLLGLMTTTPGADAADIIRHGPRRRGRFRLEADAAAGGALLRLGAARGEHSARRTAGNDRAHETIRGAGLREPVVHGVVVTRVHLVRAEVVLGQGCGGRPALSGAEAGAGHGVGRGVGVARGLAAGVGPAAPGAAVLVLGGAVGARGEAAAGGGRAEEVDVPGRRSASPLGLGLVVVVVLGRPGLGVGALGPGGPGGVVVVGHRSGCGGRV